MVNPTTGNQVVEITAVGGGTPSITSSENMSQVGGVTVAVGNGVTGTGSQRVTIASDNTPFPVKIDQTTPGTTNAVAVITGQNGIAGGTGVDGATVPRVTLATNVGLPTGTNTIGKIGNGAADETNNVFKVEERFSYGRATADAQVKGSAGFLHAVTVAGTVSAPTAGVLTIYDSLTEANTIIYSEYIPATVVPHTVVLDVVCATGIYVGFDASLANVQVTCSYR